MQVESLIARLDAMVAGGASFESVLEAAAPVSAHGSETVLLVEDEAAVRAVAREALGGGLEAGSAFLQKPLAMATFVRKVREILDAAPAAGADDAGRPGRAA